MLLNVTGGQIGEKETQAYLDRGNERFGSMLRGVDIDVLSDEEVKITYHIISEVPFERIRRITGYLVGTMDKWNDAKRAEEKERVKHDPK
ncbi:MAG: anaerobic ribonucleoside-triphosphate reductase [Clostridia bacterium]